MQKIYSSKVESRSAIGWRNTTTNSRPAFYLGRIKFLHVKRPYGHPDETQETQRFAVGITKKNAGIFGIDQSTVRIELLRFRKRRQSSSVDPAYQIILLIRYLLHLRNLTAIGQLVRLWILYKYDLHTVKPFSICVQCNLITFQHNLNRNVSLIKKNIQIRVGKLCT